MVLSENGYKGLKPHFSSNLSQVSWRNLHHGGIPSCGIWRNTWRNTIMWYLSLCKAGLFSESANTLAFPKQLFPGLEMFLLPAFTPKGTSQLNCWACQEAGSFIVVEGRESDILFWCQRSLHLLYLAQSSQQLWSDNWGVGAFSPRHLSRCYETLPSPTMNLNCNHFIV